MIIFKSEPPLDQLFCLEVKLCKNEPPWNQLNLEVKFQNQTPCCVWERHAIFPKQE